MISFYRAQHSYLIAVVTVVYNVTQLMMYLSNSHQPQTSPLLHHVTQRRSPSSYLLLSSRPLCVPISWSLH